MKDIILSNNLPELIPYSPDLTISFFEDKPADWIKIRNHRRYRSFSDYLNMFKNELEFEIKLEFKNTKPLEGYKRIIKINEIISNLSLINFKEILIKNNLFFEKYFSVSDFTKSEKFYYDYTKNGKEFQSSYFEDFVCKRYLISEKMISIIENSLDLNRIAKEDINNFNEYLKLFKWLFENNNSYSEEEYPTQMTKYVKNLWNYVLKSNETKLEMNRK